MTQKVKEYWWIAPLMALLSMVLSGFVTYSHEREATSTRVTVVETRQDDDRKRLDRIEAKIDLILQKLKDW